MKVDRSVLRMSDEEIDAYLRRQRWARVATVSAAGEPHVSPVGYVFHEGRIYFYSAASSPRTRNVREWPRVSLCIDDGLGDEDTYADRRGVIVNGEAAVLAADDRRLERVRTAYARAVVGDASVDFRRRTHVWIEVTPDKFTAWDFGRIPPGADRFAGPGRRD